MEVGVKGYIFDLMCPGAEVKGKVYNKVERHIFMKYDGTATRAYKEICRVRKMIMTNMEFFFENRILMFSWGQSTIIKYMLTTQMKAPLLSIG